MTGRGLGYCGGAARAGVGGPVTRGDWDRGSGGGFGRGGRGWRNRFWATGAPGWARGRGFSGAGWTGPDAERQWVADQARALEGELEQLRRRLGELQARDQAREGE
jgi:hypothetical protein